VPSLAALMLIENAPLAHVASATASPRMRTGFVPMQLPATVRFEPLAM